MDHRPTIRAKTIKLLQENTEVKLCDLRLGDLSLGMTPKAQGTKLKIGTLDFIQSKIFCASKDNILKVKR